MLTTAGMVFLAIAANEGGRAPSSANAAAELLLVASAMNKLAQRVSLSHLHSRGRMLSHLSILLCLTEDPRAIP
jgi:hypothetical protein